MHAVLYTFEQIPGIGLGPLYTVKTGKKVLLLGK